MSSLRLLAAASTHLDRLRDIIAEAAPPRGWYERGPLRMEHALNLDSLKNYLEELVREFNHLSTQEKADAR